jgi:hypothetical protein
MSRFPTAPAWATQRLLGGLVIPAHPLALTMERKLDERRQRALTRYYHAAGAGGLAVAVHTTQFAIRDPAYGLLVPVLQSAEVSADYKGCFAIVATMSFAHSAELTWEGIVTRACAHCTRRLQRLAKHAGAGHAVVEA